MLERTNEKLKLGKGAAFVKSRLRYVPQIDDVWEADFLRKAGYWTGLVIEKGHGFVYAMKMLETTPTVNDLASLLADAMQRLLVELRRHRPQTIRLRDNPEWQELVSHLEQLGIEVVLSGDFSAWENAAADYASHTKGLWSSLWHHPAPQ